MGLSLCAELEMRFRFLRNRCSFFLSRMRHGTLDTCENDHAMTHRRIFPSASTPVRTHVTRSSSALRRSIALMVTMVLFFPKSVVYHRTR